MSFATCDGYQVAYNRPKQDLFFVLHILPESKNKNMVGTYFLTLWGRECIKSVMHSLNKNL